MTRKSHGRGDDPPATTVCLTFPRQKGPFHHRDNA
jgi:hypothetical protein